MKCGKNKTKNKKCNIYIYIYIWRGEKLAKRKGASCKPAATTNKPNKH